MTARVFELPSHPMACFVEDVYVSVRDEVSNSVRRAMHCSAVKGYW